MASTIYENLYQNKQNSVAPNNNINNVLSRIDNLQSAVVDGDPEATYNTLLQMNPMFANFMQRNQGKTPEQIAQENGIDIRLANHLAQNFFRFFNPTR